MSEQTVQRKLAAILYADVAGYSRLTGQDEVGTHEALRVGLGLFTKAIENHGGRVNHYAGDAILAEFGSVVDCVNTAIHAQRALAAENEDIAEEERLEFRVGVHAGEVMVDGGEVYGDDVNIAARLESLADPGGICVSGLVADQVRHRIDAGVEDMGDQRVKNIAQPIRAYRVLPGRKMAPVKSAPSALPSIAVLPFDNLSGDPEQEYFSDGIAEDIITALSGIRRLHVTARNSTFSYKGQSPDVRDVAKDLDVRFVLEGSVRKAGGKVRITAQLIDGLSGNHLWAERYDRDLEDIFAVQDEITETVVAAIQPEISRAEIERARAKHPDNLDAWDLYHRGMHHYFRFTAEDGEQAVRLLRQAVEADPDLAIAHAGLAFAAIWLARDSATSDLIDEAVRSARRAIELDAEDSMGHVGLGTALLYRTMATGEGDAAEAVSALEHGVELSPTSAVCRTELALGLTVTGRAKEAIDHLQTAIRLSPKDLNMGRMMSILSIAYFATGDYGASLEWATKTRRSRTAMPWLVSLVHIAALAKHGQEAEARAELGDFLAAQPDPHDQLRIGAWTFREDLMDGLRMAGLTEV